MNHLVGPIIVDEWHQLAGDHEAVIVGFELVAKAQHLVGAVAVIERDRRMVGLHAGHVVHDAAEVPVEDHLVAAGADRDRLGLAGGIAARVDRDVGVEAAGFERRLIATRLRVGRHVFGSRARPRFCLGGGHR